MGASTDLPTADRPRPDLTGDRAAGPVPGAAPAVAEVGADLPIEAPDADAAEQAREVRPDEGDAPPAPAPSAAEADEFDAMEQSIVVETDEDDYR